ncbi:zinc finger protein ichor [Lasioglossum baleicum]|uniref:zinc finger protein ichor n=1 Tax=Lasioglossum baleicum TaxID=434251 RepID=UPI003FCD22D9
MARGGKRGSLVVDSRTIRPRGAVGGCSTPGSRVDPWWNPGPLFPSTPGPPRIDEGAPDNGNGGYQFCNPGNRNTSSPSQQSQQQQQQQHHHHHHHHSNQQRQQSSHHQPNQSNGSRNVCTSYGIASTASSSCSPSSLGHVATVARGANAVGSSTSAYGIASASPEPSSASNLILSALLTTTSSSNSIRAAPVSTGHSNNALTTSLSSSNARSIGHGGLSSADSLNGILSSLNVRIKTEEYSEIRPEERRAANPTTLSSSSSSLSSSSASAFNASLLSSLLSTSRISSGHCRSDGDEDILSRSCIKLEYPSTDTQQSQEPSQEERTVVRAIKVEYPLSQSSQDVLDTEDEELTATSPYDIISGNPGGRCLQKQQPSACGGKSQTASLVKNVVVPNCTGVVSPNSDIVIDMKYETQSGPPAAPPHLTSSGVEPPHSSQGTGIVVGGSPAEVVGVDSLLLSPWGATGPDFLEPPDVKQTAAGLQDAWDTILLNSSVGVASAQSLAELKPLPPFTGYTGHLSINGIPGHHYHTIASSAQRPSLPSSSPTSSSNQEYYESPVVSSSTPCPQGSQKQQQQQHHQHQQQQQQQQHHHHQQQQLPQSTQQVEYDIEDIAEIIGSAIADTTVPGGGNGAGSEHDPDASRDWIDIAEWIDTACSPKAQETTSPSPYSQIYATATPSNQAQQHGSTLQSLLTHGYAPLLNARLQAANAGLQNASCGETPSSTSPYPPVSPPGRVSTSCSPDHLLHSSFAAPSHPRKRSRPTPGSQNPSKKSPGAGATALPYGTESGLIGGKEKPVHRCSICNRGFLNKSNIKVHLRTHTGEKPFRCEVCAKAFRQKAHLIKHQQIHKRIGRD